MVRVATTGLVFALAMFGPALPAASKARAEFVNPHCKDDKSVSAPIRRLNCSFEGYGKFEINTEAHFKKGGPDASAQLSIVLDGLPCGHNDPMNVSGRAAIYNSCSRGETGLDNHDFTVEAEYHMADYDGMQVNVVRRPSSKHPH
jgi:hypothetical protein